MKYIAPAFFLQCIYSLKSNYWRSNALKFVHSLLAWGGEKSDGRPISRKKSRSGLHLIHNQLDWRGKFLQFTFGYHRPATGHHHGNLFIRDHKANG